MIVSAAKCLHFLAHLPYITAAKTAGIDKIKKLDHCQSMYSTFRYSSEIDLIKQQAIQHKATQSTGNT